MIIDGKVKVKQGQGIQRIEETGIRFVDGSFVEADVIVVATGNLIPRLVVLLVISAERSSV